MLTHILDYSKIPTNEIAISAKVSAQTIHNFRHLLFFCRYFLADGCVARMKTHHMTNVTVATCCCISAH